MGVKAIGVFSGSIKGGQIERLGGPPRDRSRCCGIGDLTRQLDAGAGNPSA
jgi:hypothetical protein